MLSEDRRKRMTAYLGEKWYTGPISMHNNTWDGVAMPEIFGERDNRPFTTADDMVALVKKMVEKGEWVDFCDWCYANHDEAGNVMGNTGEPLYFNAQFIAWLITDPARTCDLIGEWVEAK